MRLRETLQRLDLQAGKQADAFCGSMEKMRGFADKGRVGRAIVAGLETGGHMVASGALTIASLPVQKLSCYAENAAFGISVVFGSPLVVVGFGAMGAIDASITKASRGLSSLRGKNI